MVPAIRRSIPSILESGKDTISQLEDIDMTEDPKGGGNDFTRAEDTVLHLGDNFAARANAKSVYGEPIHAGSRTVIPVAQVGYLLGATSGGRNGETVGGGSGGGGVVARPVGYIEITDAGARYVELSSVKRLIAAVAIGFAAGCLLCGCKPLSGLLRR
jgi:uncharacterized spore protein YtfJ